MWYKINNNEDVLNFMEKMNFFHDSCIKEMKYSSGAYVNDKLSMHPVNDIRTLNIIIQRQFDEFSMIEIEFQDLKYLKLCPVDDRYTCEILEATLIFENNFFYWCDCGNPLETRLDNHTGTVVCASKIRWRPIYGCMGKSDFYKTGDGSLS